MTSYKVPIKTFYSVKHILDQAVFWRPFDKDNVEVRPISKFVKQIVSQIATEEFHT